MIKGTTPTHQFSIPFSTSEITKLHIIYSQNDTPILVKTFEDCVMEGNVVSVTLNQEDTFLFDHKCPVEIQIRVLTSENTVLSSSIIKVGVSRCLENEVLR